MVERLGFPSKIGVGVFSNLYGSGGSCVTAGQKDYAARMGLIAQTRTDQYVAMGVPPGPPTSKGIYGEAEYTGLYGDFQCDELKGDYSVPSGWPQHPYKNAAGDVPGAPVMYTQPQDPEDVGAGYGYSNAEGFTEDVFFYHSDHLGSTSYVTDGDGNATQFVAYTPFGETLVDEHAVSYESPYKFNGKEMDAETGLYYYGARYYDPSLALWYGVDALAEKYPSLGGYVYCANNPVRLIDPDGKKVKVFQLVASAGLFASIEAFRGRAYDDYGVTHFTGWQTDYTLGGAIGVGPGLAYDKSCKSFYDYVKSTILSSNALNASTQLSFNKLKMSDVIGFSVGFISHSEGFGIDGGAINLSIGYGLSIGSMSLNVYFKESISVSDAEAENLGQFWHVSGTKAVFDFNNESNNTPWNNYSVHMEGYVGEKDNRVKVYSDAILDSNGNWVSNGIWMSEEYKKAFVAHE